MEKVVIFGAGNCGKLIYDKIQGDKEILYFVDNDTNKWGTSISINGGGQYNYQISPRNKY